MKHLLRVAHSSGVINLKVFCEHGAVFGIVNVPTEDNPDKVELIVDFVGREKQSMFCFSSKNLANEARNQIMDAMEAYMNEMDRITANIIEARATEAKKVGRVLRFMDANRQYDDDEPDDNDYED